MNSILKKALLTCFAFIPSSFFAAEGQAPIKRAGTPFPPVAHTPRATYSPKKEEKETVLDLCLCNKADALLFCSRCQTAVYCSLRCLQTLQNHHGVACPGYSARALAIQKKYG